MSGFTLTDLEAIIAGRLAEGAHSSYTVTLAEAGMVRCAKKLGEEAVETVIAALSEDRPALVGEAADLVYHLLVVLAVAEVPLSDVLAELERRTGQSGLVEKAARLSD